MDIHLNNFYASNNDHLSYFVCDLFTQLLLYEASVQHQQDGTPLWRWGSTFTVQSIYKIYNNPRVVQAELRDIWSLKIHNKIKFFLWLLFQDRLNTTENLQKKGWPSNQTYILCRPLLPRHNYTCSVNANSHLTCSTD
jgi:zinc-binding in reverse transcriptase